MELILGRGARDRPHLHLVRNVAATLLLLLHSLELLWILSQQLLSAHLLPEVRRGGSHLIVVLNVQLLRISTSLRPPLSVVCHISRMASVGVSHNQALRSLHVGVLVETIHLVGHLHSGILVRRFAHLRVRIEHWDVDRIVPLLRAARSWTALSNGDPPILVLTVGTLLVILYLLREWPDSLTILLLIQLELLLVQLLARSQVEVHDHIRDVRHSILAIRVVRRVNAHLLLVLLLLSVVHVLHVSLDLRPFSASFLALGRVDEAS